MTIYTLPSKIKTKTKRISVSVNSHLSSNKKVPTSQMMKLSPKETFLVPINVEL